MSRQLILVRHGQTIHNVAGIAQGWNDSALSELGQMQVRKLAERLVSYRPTAIFSSPLGRALSTAQAISETTGVGVVTLEDLREMSYGGWEGRSFLDVRQEDEETYQRWIQDESVRCPDGESHADVRMRMQRAFDQIASTAHATIVVVAHGTAIRLGATALMNLPAMASRHFAQENAAMNVFQWRVDRWVLKAWNDTSHYLER